MKRISVVITDKRFIPTIGIGPILTAIKITKEQFDLLTKLGFNVVKTGTVTKIPINKVKNEIEGLDIVDGELREKKSENDIKPENKETVEEPVEKEVKETVEEPVDEPVETEVKEEALNLDDLSKEEIKKILDEKKISYKYNATKNELKELLK